MSEFIVDEPGPRGLFGVFEDDGETGYLYVYEPDGRGILQHLQVYVRHDALEISQGDVQVVWSADGSKCGVVIWDGMRGIIDLANKREGRATPTTRNSPAISDSDWLRGFEDASYRRR